MKQRLIVLAALLVVVSGLGSAPSLFDELDASLDPHPGSESVLVEDELAALTGVDSEIVALVDAPADTNQIDNTADQIRALAGAADVTVMSRPGTDADTALLIVTVESDLDEEQHVELLADASALINDLSAQHVTIGGSLALNEELGSTAEADLLKADIITIPLVLLLLGIVLGRVRGALFALATLVVVIFGSLAVLYLLTLFTTVSVFAVNVVTLFGVGLSVDYNLLVLSRFREELAENETIDLAIEQTTRTAGRAVIYSGLTVATSLSALMLFREPIIRSLAYGGIAATLLAVGTAHWLLPVILRKWGHNLRPAARALNSEQGMLYRVTRLVQLRPLVTGSAVVAVLLVMSMPLASLSIEGLDARSLPSSSPTRQLTEQLPDLYPEVQLNPITLLTEPQQPRVQLESLVNEVAGLAGVEDLVVTELGDRWVVQFDPPGAAADRTAIELVRSLRALNSETEFGVTGQAAEEVDLLDSISSRAPIALVVLVVLTLLLLTAFTQAPVAAAKAVLINALSVAASFGVLVWIFQNGHFSEVLGFESIGGLDAVVLLLTFAFAFGLSMDYEVFLLARIREEYDRTGDNTTAVASGLQHAGRVVSIGAALIIVVFVGFASGELLLIKQLGVGLALAVAIDASLVRLLLVPALMTVLGDWNWWTPRR